MSRNDGNTPKPNQPKPQQPKPWTPKGKGRSAVVAATFAVAVLLAGCGTDDDSGSTGPRSSSVNKDNPPAADVKMTSCEVDSGFTTAVLKVHNNSSKTSTYTITVGFLDQLDVRLDTGYALVDSLGPGKTAKVEAMAFSVAGKCKVIEVERYAS